jgi:23S rRNA (uracil1939-C5)-methyltransferase
VIGVDQPSAERVSAPCAHFGRCGGCQLQHWAGEPYLAWKRQQVVRALAKRGIEAPVGDILNAWGEGRRRAAFHAQKHGKSIRFGFVERGGARIQPIQMCPVLAPPLAAALPGLEKLAGVFAPARGDITLQCLVTDSGLDVSLKGAGAVDGMTRAVQEQAGAIAEALDLARLSFDGAPMITRRAPRVRMGPAHVLAPPGAFLQATAAGEEALGALVLEALAGAERALDLFSGIGTFGLRLAPAMAVHAVEGDADMLAALKSAADAVGGLRGVTIERRDLLRTPFSALEMKRFDAVVFDPPRSGAKLQAEQIAASKVRKVAAVSCDPATFARDVRVLIDASFTLEKITPLDQFRYSPHVEVVAALKR